MTGIEPQDVVVRSPRKILVPLFQQRFARRRYRRAHPVATFGGLPLFRKTGKLVGTTTCHGHHPKRFDKVELRTARIKAIGA
ncbi:MAG: GAF domain-containing protein [Verrucomicrobia bacterium]|nr:GAF domain-containing protein [Verrucomicrobiota bacterium]